MNNNPHTSATVPTVPNAIPIIAPVDSRLGLEVGTADLVIGGDDGKADEGGEADAARVTLRECEANGDDFAVGVPIGIKSSPDSQTGLTDTEKFDWRLESNRPVKESVAADKVYISLQ
jgi:hypothetical protein